MRFLNTSNPSSRHYIYYVATYFVLYMLPCNEFARVGRIRVKRAAVGYL